MADEKIDVKIDVDDVLGPPKPRQVMVIGPPNPSAINTALGVIRESSVLGKTQVIQEPGAVQVRIKQPPLNPGPFQKVLQTFVQRKTFDRAKPGAKNTKAKTKRKKKLQKESRRRNRR